MNRIQRNAWANMIVMSGGLILASIAFAILYPAVGVKAAVISFALFAISVFCRGLVKRFFNEDKQDVKLDERDIEISSAAFSIGQVAFVAFMLIALSASIIAYSGEGAVPLDVLFYIVLAAIFVTVLAKDIATLIFYGWGGGDGE